MGREGEGGRETGGKIERKRGKIEREGKRHRERERDRERGER